MTNTEKTARLPLGYVAPLTGLATGYGAVALQSRFAPVGVFPLLVGVVTGGAVALLLKFDEDARRRTYFLAASAAALLCLATVHYGSYLQARAAADAEFEAFQQMMRAFPQGQGNGFQNLPQPVGDFGDYVRHEFDVGRKLGPIRIDRMLLVLWWVIDGLLLWVGATVTALILVKPSAAAPPPTAGDAA